MKPISKAGQWARGLIYIAIAVISFLVTNQTFTEWAHPLTLVWMGAANVALLALRAYIDQSTDSVTVPIQAEIVNTPESPVVTEDVSEPEANEGEPGESTLPVRASVGKRARAKN